MGSVQYYERTANLVGEIRDVLDTDLTSEDNLEKLENFKRDANAYGNMPPVRKRVQALQLLGC